MSLREHIRNGLLGSPLFGLARQAYHCLHPERRVEHVRLLDLYRRFIRSQDLVFDVGANVGDYTALFTELGARVVAIEPQPGCLGRLKKVRPYGLEAAACGNTEAGIDLYLADGDSGVATVSNDWIETASQMRSFAGKRWTNSISVPMTTLDTLAKRYGVPTFVKIDVEGFEEQVLIGMTFRPRGLSFEFHTSTIDSAQRCMNRLPGYEFTLIHGNEPRLAADWGPSESILAKIQHYSGPHDFGDIFCRAMP